MDFFTVIDPVSLHQAPAYQVAAEVVFSILAFVLIGMLLQHVPSLLARASTRRKHPKGNAAKSSIKKAQLPHKQPPHVAPRKEPSSPVNDNSTSAAPSSRDTKEGINVTAAAERDSATHAQGGDTTDVLQDALHAYFNTEELLEQTLMEADPASLGSKQPSAEEAPSEQSPAKVGKKKSSEAAEQELAKKMMSSYTKSSSPGAARNNNPAGSDEKHINDKHSGSGGGSGGKKGASNSADKALDDALDVYLQDEALLSEALVDCAAASLI